MKGLEELTIAKPAPEIEEQISWIKAIIDRSAESISDLKKGEHSTIQLVDMEEELRYKQAIYQSLCIAKWVVERCTADLLSMPGNQPPKHTKCWIPFYLREKSWTIILVERGVNGHKQHPIGEVETEAQAIDWADNENFKDFQIEDRVTVAAILAGTVFEKEVHHG